MISINSNTGVPIFEQIVLEIGKLIALGIYKPDDKIPPVRTLAKDLGVNPNTVAKAYQECESKGLIYSLAGKGSYISKQDTGMNTLVSLSYGELDDLLTKLNNLGISNSEIIAYIKEKQ